MIAQGKYRVAFIAVHKAKASPIAVREAFIWAVVA